MKKKAYLIYTISLISLSNQALAGGYFDRLREIADPIIGHAQLRLMPWNVRTDLVEPLRELLEVGPNTWVKLPHEPKGKYGFQRGLSDGVFEAMNLISGRSEPFERYVSFVADASLSDVLVKNVNAGYSDPLTIRGRVNAFYTSLYDIHLNDELIANLKDPLHSGVYTACSNGTTRPKGMKSGWGDSSEDHLCADFACIEDPETKQVKAVFDESAPTELHWLLTCNQDPMASLIGSRPGETQQLKRGYSIDDVEAISTFIPRPDAWNPYTRERAFMIAEKWGNSYIRLYEALLARGIVVHVESRGLQFYETLKGLLTPVNVDGDALFAFFGRYSDEWNHVPATMNDQSESSQHGFEL